MPQQLEDTVCVRLVLLFADEAEGRRRGSRSAERVAKRIIQHAVGNALAAVRNASCGTKRIAVQELARASPSFAQSGRVHGRTVFENRACRGGTIADIVPGSAAIHLLRSQVFAVVGEGVCCAAWIRDAGDAVFHIVSNGCDIGSDGNGRAVAVAVVAIRLVRAATDACQLVMGIVAVRVRDRAPARSC